MAAKDLETVDAVIAALGGVQALAKLTGVGDTAVYNWIGDRRFPTRFHWLMTRELEHEGLSAHPTLWGQAQRVA